MSNNYVATITFKNTAVDPIDSRVITSTVNFLSFGDFKWSRNINKNAIYVQLPVEKPDEGGYGYDLGFLQDDITVTMRFYDIDKYRDLISLIKSNVGEVTAVLRIGMPPKVDEFNVLVRSCTVEGDSGGTNIQMSVVMTVVSKEFS